MPIAVVAETTIDRPRAEVAAFVADPANDQRWIKALTSVRVVSGERMGVGTRVERVAGFLGRRMVYVNEITEYEPGSRLVMQSVEAPFPMEVRYEFADAGAGTRVRVGNRGGSGLVFRVAGPLMGWMVNRQVKKDLVLLKSVLEGQGDTP